MAVERLHRIPNVARRSSYTPQTSLSEELIHTADFTLLVVQLSTTRGDTLRALENGQVNSDLEKGQTTWPAVCLPDNVGKLLERIIVTRLEDHLKKRNFIAPSQYGFRSG